MERGHLRELIVEETGNNDWFQLSEGRQDPRVGEMGLKVHPDWEDFEVTNEIFSKRIEPDLIQPTFVTRLPRELCPLAKLNQEDPDTLDVFELCIGGMEIAPAYSEQNDPAVQREMFESPGRRGYSKRGRGLSDRPRSTGCRPPAGWASESTAW